MTQKIAYGADPAQFAEWTPVSRARGVVVVIHGGYWRAAYDLALGRPLARDLVARGWSVLNLEYRRVGNGGGFPETFDDVAAAIDLLAELPEVDPAGPVVALGHSAGGHLAAWAAARGRFGWPERVAVTAVLSQAGLLDLGEAARAGLSGGAVEELLGEQPIDARVDPVQQVPLGVPIWCVHARDDVDVPFDQAQRYVAAAKAAAARAELVEVDGGHFDLIDPCSSAWAAVIQVLENAAAPD
ncbi:alpha/beta hydrolase family protein [Nocardioides sp. Bht2]|uniref:alpha/beta hydrolase family protein n=1 Tax=Nocardioides sp. Bht2 TaxID=3392297 RepID=UPI0039B59DB4